MEISIYSKPNCIFCDKAKMRLVKENPRILMLDKDFKREEFFELFPDARSFPQIVVNGRHIGTYHDAKKLFS